MNTVLDEFATAAKASDVGLTWEVHQTAKTAFERSSLKHVFTTAINILQVSLYVYVRLCFCFCFQAVAEG